MGLGSDLCLSCVREEDTDKDWHRGGHTPHVIVELHNLFYARLGRTMNRRALKKHLQCSTGIMGRNFSTFQLLF